MKLSKPIRVRLVRPAVLGGSFYDIGEEVRVSPWEAWVLWRSKVARVNHRGREH